MFSQKIGTHAPYKEGACHTSSGGSHFIGHHRHWALTCDSSKMPTCGNSHPLGNSFGRRANPGEGRPGVSSPCQVKNLVILACEDCFSGTDRGNLYDILSGKALKQCIMEYEGNVRAQKMTWPSNAAEEHSRCNNSLCHWFQTPEAKRVGLSMCKGFSTLMLSCTGLVVYNKILPFSKSCGDGRVVKQQVEVTTGSCSHKPVCRWPLDQWSLISVPRAAEEFGSIQGNGAALFRIALLTLHKEGHRKGSLNIVYPMHIWLACHS